MQSKTIKTLNMTVDTLNLVSSPFSHTNVRLILDKISVSYRFERFFRYLKERTVVFHHKMSARNHVQGITNLKLFLTLFTLYYQAAKTGR